ncbi:hypothetical protein HDK64DRAFT_280508 [Phyllosticta capitalensis]
MVGWVVALPPVSVSRFSLQRLCFCFCFCFCFFGSSLSVLYVRTLDLLYQSALSVSPVLSAFIKGWMDRLTD